MISEEAVRQRSKWNREEREELEAARRDPLAGLVSLGEQQIRQPRSGRHKARIMTVEAFVDINNPQRVFYRTPGTDVPQPLFDEQPSPPPEDLGTSRKAWPSDEPATPTKEEVLEAPDEITAAAARLLAGWMRGR